ncbi:hypothetical protein A3840_17125 [Devosia elaeis]|uniref:Uncharacterized protein n=1 Tax=Devosia elaeis TaxID=1770058 RepID=A0A178HMU8_9HYPH|nr:hypothetical protein A3840_17125 [Devosia elaeis]
MQPLNLIAGSHRFSFSALGKDLRDDWPDQIEDTRRKVVHRLRRLLTQCFKMLQYRWFRATADRGDHRVGGGALVVQMKLRDGCVSACKIDPVMGVIGI